jgi:hypothetical protein
MWLVRSRLNFQATYKMKQRRSVRSIASKLKRSCKSLSCTGSCWSSFDDLIEGECPIFRWVGINPIWWLLTLTIRLRQARLEAPMQSLNQLPMVTNLAGARSAWSRRSIPIRNRRTNKNLRRAISLEGGVWITRRRHDGGCSVIAKANK